MVRRALLFFAGDFGIEWTRDNDRGRWRTKNQTWDSCPPAIPDSCPVKKLAQPQQQQPPQPQQLEHQQQQQQPPTTAIGRARTSLHAFPGTVRLTNGPYSPGTSFTVRVRLESWRDVGAVTIRSRLLSRSQRPEQAGTPAGAALTCTEPRLVPSSAAVQTTCTPASGSSSGHALALLVRAEMRDGRVLTAPVQRLVVS